MSNYSGVEGVLPSYEHGERIARALEALAEQQGAEIQSKIEYGIRFALGTDGNTASTPAGTRVIRYNGVINTLWEPNFTANVGDGSQVTVINDNDFDLISIFSPEKWIDGAGNEFRRFKPFYWGRQKLGGYLYIWVCESPLYSFYKMPQAFLYKGKPCYCDIGVYEGGTETIGSTTYLCSKSGKNVVHNQNCTTFVNRAKAWETYLSVDTDKEWYGITQTSEITEILQPLLTIMFGTRNSQAIYNGNITGSYADTALSIVAYDETTMTLYFTASAGLTQFRVGSTLSINASATETYYRRVIANGTKTGSVTDKVFTESASGTTYYYVVIEGDSFPATPTSICLRPIFTGETDSIEATHGTLSNDGYHSFKVLGIENIYGNSWKSICDTRLYNYVPQKLKDPYTFTEFSTSNYTTYYEAANYEVAKTMSTYAKEFGYDEDKPDVQFAIIVGGSSTTYYCDYNWVADGARTIFFGGRVGGGACCGLFCWHLSDAVGNSDWHRCARLSHRALIGG